MDGSRSSSDRMMDSKIKEAYVSFEVAKLLKDKGFDVYEYGCENEIRKEYLSDGTIKTLYASKPHMDAWPAPTQAMAMAWCREVHKLHIGIVRGPCGYHITIETIPLGVVKYITREITRTAYYVESYEEAAEAALGYILKNLI